MLRKLFYLVLIIALIVGGYYLITTYWPKGGTSVVFNTASGAHTYTVETVDNKEAREKGLMDREKLDADKGMLFVFQEEGRVAFWMKNMKFPLDMIFMDKDYKVVDYFENVPACTIDPCPHYRPGVDSKYVVEVKAGTIREIGLKKGDLVEYK